ncbi:hypothetical protein Syun_025275 [Stephania yunnanensis]|uniref:Transposase MuDR plant domain-containing protein n=1 Tax=Stephania yunnanensis TaxID=152371 RepID=A0AAP0ERC8_9MAGN
MRYLEFDEFKEVGDPQLQLGMKFFSFKTFKLACRNWGIQNKRQIRFTVNDRKRCICKCQRFKSSNYEFRIFASHVGKNDSTVKIKSINLTHSCTKVNKNYHMTSDWLVEKYIEQFRVDPNWLVSDIIQRVKDDLKFHISRMKAWRAKKKAMEMMNGDEKSQYLKLNSYPLELQKTNPGTTVKMTQHLGVFQGIYIYICLAPLKNAYNPGCRPLISLDGCWLKGQHKGQLLVD